MWPWGNHSASLSLSPPLLSTETAGQGIPGIRPEHTASCIHRKRMERPGQRFQNPAAAPCLRHAWGHLLCSVPSSGTLAFSLASLPPPKTRAVSPPRSGRGGFQSLPGQGKAAGKRPLPTPTQSPSREAKAAKQEGVGGRGQKARPFSPAGPWGTGESRHVIPACGSQAKEAGAQAQLWGSEGALPDTPTPWLQPRASRRTPPPSHL